MAPIPHDYDPLAPDTREVHPLAGEPDPPRGYEPFAPKPPSPPRTPPSPPAPPPRERPPGRPDVPQPPPIAIAPPTPLRTEHSEPPGGGAPVRLSGASSVGGLRRPAGGRRPESRRRDARARAHLRSDPAGGGVRRHGRHAIAPADQGRVPHAHDAVPAGRKQPAQVFRQRRRRAPQPAGEAQCRLSRAGGGVRRRLRRFAESPDRHAGRHAGGVRIDARRVRSGSPAAGVRPSARQRA